MKHRIEASEYFAILPEAVLFAPISSNAVRLYCILRRRADEKAMFMTDVIHAIGY